MQTVEITRTNWMSLLISSNLIENYENDLTQRVSLTSHGDFFTYIREGLN